MSDGELAVSRPPDVCGWPQHSRADAQNCDLAGLGVSDFGSTGALADVDLRCLESCESSEPGGLSTLTAASCADAIVGVRSSTPVPCCVAAASEVEVVLSEAALCIGVAQPADPVLVSSAAHGCGVGLEEMLVVAEAPRDPLVLDGDEGRVASQEGSPRSATSSHAANSGTKWSRWPVNAQVERLLDDVSDIWIGAIITVAYPGDVYDITYIDDGTLETDVDGCELRGRSLSLPGDIWSRTCSFLSDPMVLCFVEESSTEARRTLVEYAEELWCVAYHCRFGRCGPLCPLPNKPHNNPADVGLAAQVAVDCAAKVADPWRAERQKRPWKVKFAERHQDDKKRALELECPALAAQLVAGDDDGSPTGAFIDDRMRFGRNALRGMYFDQVLGQMVREDGGPESRVVISRGRTSYSF